MVFQNVGVVELCVHLGFREGLVEVLLGLLGVTGSFDADDLDGILLSIALAFDFVDFRKTAFS